MKTRPQQRRLLICWLALQAVGLLGCAGLRLPAIDPSGERIFLPTSTANVTPLGGEGLLGYDADAGFATLPVVPPGGTYGPTQEYGWQPHPLTLPGSQLPPFPGATVPTAAAPVAPPQPLLPRGYETAYDYNNALASSGGNPFRAFDAQLGIYPRRIVAPVGQSVVLQAGICGTDGYFVNDQPIEWSLSPDSVGSIVEVDRTDQTWAQLLLHRPPKKRSGSYALGRTSIAPQILTRGNNNAADDIRLREGETWIRLNSASEGATHITAVAPTVIGWEQRQQTATIHWVDGRWQFPAPAISNYGGGHTLVTRITRATDGIPVENWLVRYEVTGGAPAAFDMNGAQTIEQPTDANGEAAVVLISQGEFSGVTQVDMQVIRRGRSPGDLPRLPVGRGSTSVTWTNDGGSVPAPIPGDTPPGPVPVTQRPVLMSRVSGPSVAEVDGTTTYTLNIDNLGNSTAENVEVSCEVPNGFEYIDSTPQANVFGSSLRWSVGAIDPGAPRSLVVNFRVRGTGEIRVCATARDAQAEDATDCVTTLVRSSQPQLSLRVVGSQSAELNQQVHYDLFVDNVSNVGISNFDVNVTFDDGLMHDQDTQQVGRISKPVVGNLGPGESWSPIALNFTAVKVGRRCFNVEIVTNNGGRAQQQVCVDISNVGGTGAAPTGPIAPPPTTNPGLGPPPIPSSNDSPSLNLDLGNNASTTPVAAANESLSVVVRRAGADANNTNLLRYVVQVLNNNPQPDGNVSLVVRIPPGTQYESSTPPNGINAAHDAASREVRFSPIATVRPYERVDFHVRVAQDAAAPPPNPGEFQVRVTSDLTTKPIFVDDRL